MIVVIFIALDFIPQTSHAANQWMEKRRKKKMTMMMMMMWRPKLRRSSHSGQKQRNGQARHVQCIPMLSSLFVLHSFYCCYYSDCRCFLFPSWCKEGRKRMNEGANERMKKRKGWWFQRRIGVDVIILTHSLVTSQLCESVVSKVEQRKQRNAEP